MREELLRVLKDEEGQGMIEYGLIITGIAMVEIAAVWLLSLTTGDLIANVPDSI